MIKILLLIFLSVLYSCDQSINSNINKEPNIVINEVFFFDSANNLVSELSPGENIHIQISGTNIGKISSNVKIRHYSNDSRITVTSNTTDAYNMTTNEIVDFNERFLFSIDPAAAQDYSTTIYFEFYNETGIICTQPVTLNIGTNHIKDISIISTNLPLEINAGGSKEFEVILKNGTDKNITVSNVIFESNGPVKFIPRHFSGTFNSGEKIKLSNIIVSVFDNAVIDSTISVRIILIDKDLNRYQCELKFKVKKLIPQIRVGMGRYFATTSIHNVLYKNTLTSFDLVLTNYGSTTAKGLKIKIIGSNIYDTAPSITFDLPVWNHADSEGNLSQSANFLKGNGRFTIHTDKTYNNIDVIVTDDEGNEWSNKLTLETADRDIEFSILKINFTLDHIGNNDGIPNPGELSFFNALIQTTSSNSIWAEVRPFSTTKNLRTAGYSYWAGNSAKAALMLTEISISIDRNAVPGQSYPLCLMIIDNYNIWNIKTYIEVK